MIDIILARKLWEEIHSLPSEKINLDQQKVFVATWILQVGHLLDCATCFRKLERFLNMWHPDFGEGFHFWTICLHDYVNKELGRPLFYPELTLAPLTEKGIIQ